jgi:hypothetical protein
MISRSHDIRHKIKHVPDLWGPGPARSVSFTAEFSSNFDSKNMTSTLTTNFSWKKMT